MLRRIPFNDMYDIYWKLSMTPSISDVELDKCLLQHGWTEEAFMRIVDERINNAG
jgi:hypothetical protein